MKAQSATSAQSLRATGSARRPGPPRSRAWRKMIPYVIGGALLAALVAGLMPRALEVEVETAKIGPLTVTVLEEGKTRIRHRYIISPPVAGYLNRVSLRPGARVEEGKTAVATIHPSPRDSLILALAPRPMRA